MEIPTHYCVCVCEIGQHETPDTNENRPEPRKLSFMVASLFGVGDDTTEFDTIMNDFGTPEEKSRNETGQTNANEKTKIDGIDSTLQRFMFNFSSE